MKNYSNFEISENFENCLENEKKLEEVYKKLKKFKNYLDGKEKKLIDDEKNFKLRKKELNDSVKELEKERKIFNKYILWKTKELNDRINEFQNEFSKTCHILNNRNIMIQNNKMKKNSFIVEEQFNFSFIQNNFDKKEVASLKIPKKDQNKLLHLVSFTLNHKVIENKEKLYNTLNNEKFVYSLKINENENENVFKKIEDYSVFIEKMNEIAKLEKVLKEKEEILDLKIKMNQEIEEKFLSLELAETVAMKKIEIQQKILDRSSRSLNNTSGNISQRFNKSKFF